MNDKIIIIHLLMYLQNMIDNGQHKLFYNDLMHDEKVIDIINAITNLQEENERINTELDTYKDEFCKDTIKEYELAMEQEYYKSRCEKAIEYIEENKDKYYHDWGEDDGSYDTYLDETEIDKLSNILNGGDVNELE